MDDNRIRPAVWIAVVGGLALVGAAVFLLQPKHAPKTAAETRPAEEKAASAADDGESRHGRREERGASPSGAAAPQDIPYIDGLVYGDIDLREAKALMPDNIYWQQGAPTKDPAELARREEEKKKRNEEYGRVLAGDASEDEVRAYYDYKKRVSEDYLQFSEFMARRYKGSEHTEMVGLLDMATKMHSELLQQLPAELEEALQRARDRAKVREDWQRQKEEFGDVPPDPSSEDDE
jgi:hypothetical protein